MAVPGVLGAPGLYLLHHSDCRDVAELSDRLASMLMRRFLVFRGCRIRFVDQRCGDGDAGFRRQARNNLVANGFDAFWIEENLYRYGLDDLNEIARCVVITLRNVNTNNHSCFRRPAASGGCFQTSVPPARRRTVSICFRSSFAELTLSHGSKKIGSGPPQNWKSTQSSAAPGDYRCGN